ncbi:hypothetical protein [Streptomyces sp. NPDC059063]|uniref:hypothetical protein n=1 Tax=Streptomyces sp. NPDC059063 TaxID=3346712 RepID=UPI0036B1021F
MGIPDLVAPVREAAVNQQLRWALRSWTANLPHRHVWVAGHRPAWLADEVRHIPVRQDGTGYANTTAAMRAACEHPGVSDPFVWANDDMFTMRPLPDGMPVLHRGPMRELVAARAGQSGPYVDGLRHTYAWLTGRGHEPLSYDLHVPLPVSKGAMLAALDEGRGHDAHKRTVYGVLTQIGGERIDDVKIMHRAPRGYGPESLFLSTMPDSFANGRVGAFIRAAFPLACRYERSGRR